MGTAYLLHFDRALGNSHNPRGMARHYIGWADDVDARLADHRAGRGARLLAACVREGIGWEVVRTWPGVTRSTERALKNRKQAWSLCPVCLVERRRRERARRRTAPRRADADSETTGAVA